MIETAANFHVSKCTVSKRQHCFILHLGDGRQCVWHRHGEPCWVTTSATWRQWRGWEDFSVTFLIWQGGAGADQRDIECHKVPRKNLGPSLAAVLGCSGPPESCSLHFVGQQLHTPHSATGYSKTGFSPVARFAGFAADLGLMVSSLGYGMHDSINVTRMLPWPTKAHEHWMFEVICSPSWNGILQPLA